MLFGILATQSSTVILYVPVLKPGTLTVIVYVPSSNTGINALPSAFTETVLLSLFPSVMVIVAFFKFKSVVVSSLSTTVISTFGQSFVVGNSTTYLQSAKNNSSAEISIAF